MTRSEKMAIGWAVNGRLEPHYWVKKWGESKPGMQKDTDLVHVDAANVDAHTAIIAQSGAGKSFFLGRLVEEIIMNTWSRCVIVDPNADFRDFDDVQPDTLWTEAHYDKLTGKGKLPTEANREIFLKRWPVNQIQILGQNIPPGRANHRPFKFQWLLMNMDILAPNLQPSEQAGLRLCHDFLRTVAACLLLPKVPRDDRRRAFRLAETVLNLSREQKTREQAQGIVEDVLGMLDWETIRCDGMADVVTRLGRAAVPYLHNLVFNPALADAPSDWPSKVRNAREELVNSLLGASRYISPDTVRFYFSVVNEYESRQLLDDVHVPGKGSEHTHLRVRVLDMPSFESRGQRLLAVNALLEEEWQMAKANWQKAVDDLPENDRRAPTFLILDEAHNLIPIVTNDVVSRVVKEQLQQIIAEGRKYGLFLVMVTQRPDKLDPTILSECENYAIMRLSAASTLTYMRKTLNLDDVPPAYLGKCLDFKLGRVLLAGRWAPRNGAFCVTAARRTKEGGRSLRPEHWAQQPTTDPGTP